MARLFLTPGQTFGTVGAFDTDIFGTNSNETVFLTANAIADFDPSFNRGGDIINIAGLAELYSASLVGSSLKLTAANGALITVPVGQPTTINFLDASRELKVVNGQVFLGAQQVTATPAPVAEGEFVGVFTLKEAVIEGTDGTPPTPGERVVYWGYNPHDHEHGGHGGSEGSGYGGGGGGGLGDEAPSDGGVPLATLVQFLTTITGLDLAELGLIDDDGVGPFDNVTNLSISNAISLSGEVEAEEDPDRAPYLIITYGDGTQAQFNIEAQIAEQYFNFLNNLLFDEEGNSRLYEVEIGGTPGTEGDPDRLVPIVLTPNQNNGGTIETGYTTGADETIVVGRLELLHQAYINGGGGYNTLEVDAKGTYAQPLALLNIQEIQVNDLPNFYTTGYGEGDGNLGNELFTGEEDGIPGEYDVPVNEDQDIPSTPFPEPTGGRGKYADNSWIDINRAIDLEKLIITDQGTDGVIDEEGREGSGHMGGEEGTTGLPSSQRSGDLTIVGVRNGAVLRLEGSFTSGATTVMYGEGVNEDGLCVELAVGTVTAPINILQNSAVLHIKSEGISNYLDDFFAGGYLTHMYISGTGRFGVEDDLDDSFRDDTPVVIDASDNSGGVDLKLTDSQNVTIHGSWGDDRFVIRTDDVDTEDGNPTNDESVVIHGGAGNNYYQIAGAEIVTITNDNGNNNYEIENTSGQQGYSLPAVGLVTITTGNGNNHFELDDVATAILTAGNGNNRFDIQSNNGGDYSDPDDDSFDYVSDVSITVGNGRNVINVDADQDIGKVKIVTGSGGNTIAVDAQTIEITTAGAAANSIRADGDVITINNAASNGSTIVLGGDGDDFNDIDNPLGGNSESTSGPGSPEDFGISQTALIKIQAGSSATVVLGDDRNKVDDADNNHPDDLSSITALSGSFITGQDLTLEVRTVADVRAATLTGITSVIIDDDNFDVGDAPTANSATAGGNAAVLILTDTQFKAIGAENFSVDGAVFNTHGFIKIIVTQSTSLTALGVDSLPRNIDLILEVQDGVTLTMTAQQLHERVAQDGVTVVKDGNTDLGNGRIVITGGGVNFDPFNNTDTVQTIIAGVKYYGGSLSNDFWVDSNSDGMWQPGEFASNVVVNSVFGGYNRPADAVAEVVLTVDSAVTPTVGALSTFHNNLEIVGTTDVTFTSPIKLAMQSGVPSGPFTIDFSAFGGSVIDLVVDNFEWLGQGGGIYGNSNTVGPVEVGIVIEANEGGDGSGNSYGFDEATAGGLVSQGVTKYVVTTIEGNTAGYTPPVAGAGGGIATIKLCDQTEDLEVLAFRGNWNDTLEVLDAAWGLVFELQGGSTAKADGPTGTANVGALEANYKWAGAAAVVNLVHSVAGDTRPIKSYGIDVNNAGTLTVNSPEGSATIDYIEGDAATSAMTFTSTGNITIGSAVSIDGFGSASTTDGLGTIDASGVSGNFTATLTGDAKTGGFDFVAADGTTTLTLDGVDLNTGSSLTADLGATFNLVIKSTGGDGSNLSSAVLTGVDKITLGNGLGGVSGEVTLTMGQVLAIGAANIVDDGNPSTTATLNIVNYAGEAFDANTLGANVWVGSVTTASGAVVFDPTAVFNRTPTDLDSPDLNIPEGGTVTMTASQFMAFDVISIVANAGITAGTTLNITGLTQAHIDAGFSLAGLGDLVGTVALAEDVVLTGPSGPTNLGANLGSNFEFLIGTHSLGVATQNQADNLQVTGEAGSYVKMLFNEYAFLGDEDAGFGPTLPGFGLDVSGYDVPQILVSDLLINSVPSNNVDSLLRGLQVGVEKVIFNDYVQQYDQVLTLLPGAVIRNDIVVVDRVEDDIELATFTLNLQGGNVVQGLSFSNQLTEDPDLIKTYLQTVTINSTGTTPNPVSGDPTNIIIGGLSANNSTSPNFPGFNGNDLLNVVINASQALDIQGTLAFNKVSNEDGIDRGDSPALLTVTGTADVSIGELEADDPDINGLNVVNNGTGTLTVGIDGNNIDGDDPLSFTGTGDIQLQVGNTVDLTDDDLDAVTQIELELGATLSVTLDQATDIGAANFIVNDDDNAATNVTTLNLVGLDNQPFSLAPYDDDLTITVTLVDTQGDGVITLNPATNLTGISALVVPANTTLELTLAQFQQLNGDGTITGPGSVHITQVTQAAADNGDPDGQGDGLDLDDVDVGGTVTLTLAEDVDLTLADLADPGFPFVVPKVDVFNIGGFELILGDIQVADGVDVNGGPGSILKFSDLEILPLEDIDASGFDVESLYVLNVAIDNNNIDDVFENLPASVIKVIYNDFGNVVSREQTVIVEPTVTVPGGLGFNDSNPDVEVTKLTIELQGGTEVGPWTFGTVGDPVAISILAQDSDNLPLFLQELNIISSGTAANLLSGDTENVILGDISPLDTFVGLVNPPFPQRDNQLKLVNVVATQDLIVDGSLIFNVFGEDEGDPPEYQGDPLPPVYLETEEDVFLNFSGTADFTIDHLNITDNDINILTVNHTGTGVLTITGGSPAILTATDPTFAPIANLSFDTQHIVFKGTGDIVLGDDNPGTTNTGIGDGAVEGDELIASINASQLTGDLNLGEIADVYTREFVLTTGTGQTYAHLSGGRLDSTGPDATPGNGDDTLGWVFDYTLAGVGSELHIDAGTIDNIVAGSNLTFLMGPNGTLYIDGVPGDVVDLRAVDLTIVQNLPIVLADGVTLMLTAAQANGLDIIGGPNVNPGVVPAVWVEVSDDALPGDNANPVNTDLSGIAVGGRIFLKAGDEDVTFAAGANLGNFNVTLVVNNDNEFVPDFGETVRFNTEAQASRAIDVVETINLGTATVTNFVDNGDIHPTHNTNSSNVVWLFNTIASPTGVNTDNYDAALGRLWFSAQLVANEGGNVENLFTTLPLTILRVDFADIDAILLPSNQIHRIFEVGSFEILPDISFVDGGINPEEHIQDITFRLGGNVVIGDIEFDDIIASPTTDPDSVSFDWAQFDSRVAYDDDHFLANKNYTNDNDGTAESGENVLPNPVNKVGDISVGAQDTIDLLDVRVFTYANAPSGGGDQTVGILANGSDGDDGAAFEAQTLYFDSETAGSLAFLDVNGENDVTFKSLDIATSPAIVAQFTNVVDHSGVFTVTGGSPAIDMGTKGEGYQLDTGALSTVLLGTKQDTVNNVPFAGIAGNELSHVTVTGAGDADLGTIALVDSTDDLAFDINGDGDTTDIDNNFDGDVTDGGEAGALVGANDRPDYFEQANVAFTLDGNAELGGTTVARMGAANVNGVVTAPQLNTGQTWVLRDATVTFSDEVILQPGGILNLNNVDLIIEGDVDFSDIVLVISGGTTITVPAGSSLTIDVDQAVQADMVNIVGEGTIHLVGDATDFELNTPPADDIGDHLNTAVVNASQVIIDNITDKVFTLALDGAIDDDGITAIGQTVIGTKFNDDLTLNDPAAGATLDYVFDGGLGDDTLRAPTLADHTFLVTAGTDTIIPLLGVDPTAAPTSDFDDEQDILVVSAGATAIAQSLDFYATSATKNAGTAEINANAQGRTIDLTLALGPNGYLINGATTDLAGPGETLTGSDFNDTINGGAVTQQNAGADILTGNGGADLFEFDIQANAAATFVTTVVQQGIDRETIDFAGTTDVDTGIEQISISLQRNLGIPFSVLVDETTYGSPINFNDPNSIAAAAASLINAIAGIGATASGSVVTITGDGGAAVDVGPILQANISGFSVAVANGTDVAQITRINVEGTPTAGDIYSLTTDPETGPNSTSTFTAGSAPFPALTENAIAGGLEFNFTDSPWAVATIPGPDLSIIEITDPNADDGGFTVQVDTDAAYSGSGASPILTGGATEYLSADVITDFNGAEGDRVTFGLPVGGVYAEAVGVTSYLDALTAANAAFNGTVQYYLTSASDLDNAVGTGLVEGQEGAGLLFADVNLDGNADLVVVMLGINSGNFQSGYIA